MSTATQLPEESSSHSATSLCAQAQLADGILSPAPKWAPGVRHTGHGLFAVRSFRKGEIIGQFGGRLVAAEAIDDYVREVGNFGLQVHPNWYVCPGSAEEISQHGTIRHSCAPNVGLSDALTLVTMRDIVASQETHVEFLIDYAMTGLPATSFFSCVCGAPACRGEVTGDDWRIKELQLAYRGYFPPFKARLIEPGTGTACALTAALDNLPRAGGPRTLAACYDALLFDAMGVLINESGALPGAAHVLARLNTLGQPYYIVTNISSGSDHTILNRLRDAGLPIPSVDRIVSAGGVVRQRIRKELKDGRIVAYLGCASIAHEIFGEHSHLCCAETAETFDTLLVLDDEGFDFKQAADRILSVFQRKLVETREMPSLISANADVIYPGKKRSLVFGPGIILPMLAAGLAPFGAPRISAEVMGKPGSAIFEECISRAKSHRLLMVGDQIETDVKGAKAVGLDSLLVSTGLGSYGGLHQDIDSSPDYVANNLYQIFDGSLLPGLRRQPFNGSDQRVVMR
ncbi:HAD-IA family hydrolase [Paraburkholderia phenoliruptrix]|uniref:Post-SET domain-containing protein n=2 Tax=Paraburkholderia phenoliruptrix TaxID=252970 RepID=K0DZI9_9BURK|nr:HAD-IA family hydrolase [Paraburkholderia phenoliruptrix]AFT90280.1 hypothetical protein BUPH_05022 [Paraburkholderia phenoliruptrix BR3459a]CAB4051700.1 hypothetical protein LMG9964_05379 [Paraburkholderia phenoliruptrix]